MPSSLKPLLFTLSYHHMGTNRTGNVLSMSLEAHFLIQWLLVESIGVGKSKNKKSENKSDKIEETTETVS